MATVYVLKGKEYLVNLDWDDLEEVTIFGIYKSFRKAKAAFEEKVVEIADALDGFPCNKNTIFTDKEATEVDYGWHCSVGEKNCSWELCLPEDVESEDGVWRVPQLTVEPYTVK